VVWCSPAERARQTLDALRPVLGRAVEVRIEPVVYHGGPEALIALVRGLPPSTTAAMIVGHNPTLQLLALQLAAADASDALRRLRVKLPTGALVTLVVPARWDRLASGNARLRELWTPR
jgi:phosphohistidine phosphatase